MDDVKKEGLAPDKVPKGVDPSTQELDISAAFAMGMLLGLVLGFLGGWVVF